MGNYDVVVVGSGLVALTASHALSQAGCRVARVGQLADGAAAKDDRAIALSAASLEALQSWGLASALLQAASIQQVHVSVKGRYGVVRLCARELAVPQLGQVVAAKHLLAALHRTVATTSEVCYTGAVTAVVISAAGVRLNCQQSHGATSISAPLLVVADGAGAFMQQHMAAHTMVDDYQQYALAAQVQCAVPHQQVAYERFLPTGPLAMLPTSDAQRVAMVWALPTATAKQYANLSDEACGAHVQKAFGYRLGRLALASPLTCFPLQRRRTRPLTQPGVVLLGNAASTCHPVAGQGFNLAVRDVVRLLAVLSGQQASVTAGVSACVSEVFEQQSGLDHQQVTQYTHWLAKCFAVDMPYLSALGGIGLCGIDALPGLKQRIGRRAMGYGCYQSIGGQHETL